MSGSKVGRNDPCPCGSGKKYKKCCLKSGNGERPKAPNGLLDELGETVAGREFASLEELQAFSDRLTEERNRAPLEDFQGLSPEQMMRLLYFPYESLEVVEFKEVLPIEPAAPVMALFELLVEAAGEKGLKATAKGNLPRAFCREAALRYWGEEKYAERTRYGTINKEADFPDLHALRVTAEFAGLLNLRSGRFRLTGRCRQILKRSGTAEAYPRLLRAYAQKLNWPYRDRYPELDLIQASFAFTLYLLARFGGTARSNRDYENWFLGAFPMVVEEVDGGWHRSDEELVGDCYTFRALVRFAGFFGLARLEPVSDSPVDREYRVEKLPLLEQAVRFHLLTSPRPASQLN